LLDETLQVHISVATDITAQPTEMRQPDYPLVALQQLTRNAVMHRTYEERMHRYGLRGLATALKSKIQVARSGK
jgi:predicted HTH transcriptional regulator